MIMIILLSCTQSEVTSNNDEDLIEIVKKIEAIDHKFSNFYLTYDDYAKYINELAGNIDIGSHYNRKYVPKPIDLKNMTENELSIARDNNLQESVITEISDVLNFEYLKYIFTKSTVVPKDISENNNGIIITKLYIFWNEDDNWTISSIDRMIYSSDFPDKDMKYNKFNNDIVKYSYYFKPLEYSF